MKIPLLSLGNYRIVRGDEPAARVAARLAADPVSFLVVRRKLAHDLYYIRHLNPSLDLRILICTAFYALGIPFRILSRIFNVPASNVIERSMRDVVSDTPEPIRSRLAA